MDVQALAGRSIVPLLAIAVFLSGCSESAPWHGRDVDRQDPPYLNAMLSAGWSARLDFDLAGGQELWWDWFVEQRLEVGFAVYRHTGNGLQLVEDAPGVEDEGRMQAAVPGYHSLVWRNTSGQNVTIMARMPDATWGTSYPPGADVLNSDPCPGGRSRCIPVPWLPLEA